jgi:hypothetical protein
MTTGCRGQVDAAASRSFPRSGATPNGNSILLDPTAPRRSDGIACHKKPLLALTASDPNEMRWFSHSADGV